MAEPITAFQAAQAIAAAVSFVAGVQNQQALNARLSDIRSALDVVISNQRIIIEQIESLKLYIDQALWDRFRQENAFDLWALRDQFDILTADNFGSSDAPAYNALATEIADKTNRIGLYDFAAFIAFSSGAAMTLTLRKYVPLSASRSKALLRSFAMKLKVWLDGSQPTSVGRAIVKAEERITELSNAAASHPRVHFVRVDRDVGVGGRKFCDIDHMAQTEGDLENGFRETYFTRQVRCYVEPRGRFSLDVNLLVERGTPDYGGIPEEITSIGGSPYTVALNDIRNQWISARKRVADLKFLEEQMLLCYKSLLVALGEQVDELDNPVA